MTVIHHVAVVKLRLKVRPKGQIVIPKALREKCVSGRMATSWSSSGMMSS
jgi:hypothetical protein